MAVRKLTKEQLVAAVVLRALGLSYAEIGKILKVGKSTVFRALENLNDKKIAEAVDLFHAHLLGVEENRSRDIDSEIAKIWQEIEKIKEKLEAKSLD